MLKNNFFFISDDGRVFVWGKNEDGEIGMGEEETISIPTQLPFDRPAVSLDSGYYHSAVVTGKLCLLFNIFA